MKASAKANSNTALIKYWGKADEELIIPMNNSISITVDSLSTITTVEFSEDHKEDSLILNKEITTDKAFTSVSKHLDILRDLANISEKAKVVSENNFPTAAGLASSASGFAALTVAACAALGLQKNEKELSMLSRRGSGSSARSILGGYVEWIKDDGKGNSYAKQLAKKDWFDIRDIIVVFDQYDRHMSTREAMKLSMETSPFFQTRLDTIDDNLALIRQAIQDRDFHTIGQTAERDCLSMHSVAITSRPSQLFWSCETLGIMKLVRTLREEGFEVYFTIDTGANMHLLTTPQYDKEIRGILNRIPYVKKIIMAKPGDGAKVIDEYLF